MTTADGWRQSSADQPDLADEAIDRRGRDGDAGAGDMLGGFGAGAGDRLGPDLDDEEARDDPGNKRAFVEEFQINAGINDHGVDKRE